MSIASMFGLGEKRIIAQDESCTGIVDRVQDCWWMKVNTKAIRMHSLDGSKFPHIIYFSYKVGDIEYKGSRWLDAYTRCPMKGEQLRVWYDADEPEKYAVEI